MFKIYVLLIALFLIGPAYGKLVVVVSAANNTNISKDMLKNIYLGKDNSMTPVNSEGLQATFFQKVTGKSVSQMNKVWGIIVFRGQGAKPKVFSSDDQVTNHIKGNPKAIGYIGSTVPAGLKKILTID